MGDELAKNSNLFLLTFGCSIRRRRMTKLCSIFSRLMIYPVIILHDCYTRSRAAFVTTQTYHCVSSDGMSNTYTATPDKQQFFCFLYTHVHGYLKTCYAQASSQRVSEDLLCQIQMLFQPPRSCKSLLAGRSQFQFTYISNKYTHTIETYTKIVSSVPVNYLQLCRTVRQYEHYRALVFCPIALNSVYRAYISSVTYNFIVNILCHL